MEAIGNVPIGGLEWYAGRTDPSPALMIADGRPLSRTTYPACFAALCPLIGTVTFSGATITSSVPHKLVVGDTVFFTTTGTLTGASANTPYYVTSVPSSTQFTVTAAITGVGAAAAYGTNLTITGTGSTSVYSAPHGVPAGDATSFYLPDHRGRGTFGADDAKTTTQNGAGTVGAAAGRLANQFKAQGRSEYGVEQHQLGAGGRTGESGKGGYAGTTGHAHGGATGGANVPIATNTSPGTGGPNSDHSHSLPAVGTNIENNNHTHSVGYAPVGALSQANSGGRTTHYFAGGVNSYFASTYNGLGAHGGVVGHNWAGDDHYHSGFNIPAMNTNSMNVPNLSVPASAAAAASSPHNNMPPYLAQSKIIRVL